VRHVGPGTLLEQFSGKVQDGTRPGRGEIDSPGSFFSEGHSKLEAIRCLKRYIAREVFYIIRRRQHEINATQTAT
jgi:hypothetical protein